ncbi:MAG: hypothetical protein WC070_01770 [Candidatus Magasanikbacteria bacterium]
MLQFFTTLLQAVLLQLTGLFGIFFIIGFFQSIIQQKTLENYQRSLGWKGILWTAWMGTPIHEMGHYFFAKVFHHRVDKVSIFAPNEESGNLGHVDHSYNTKSIYQRLGNFFIGAAPMIFGSIVLVIFLYFFVPNAKEIFNPLFASFNNPLEFLKAIYESLKNLFAIDNINKWNFWLFFYLSLAVASHMAPSKPDRRGMWSGFFWIVLLMIIVNIITLLLGVDITVYILNLSQFLGLFIAIFVYGLLLSFLHYLISILLLVLFRKRF